MFNFSKKATPKESKTELAFELFSDLCNVLQQPDPERAVKEFLHRHENQPYYDVLKKRADMLLAIERDKS